MTWSRTWVMPFFAREKILRQLDNGTEIVLTDNEWNELDENKSPSSPDIRGLDIKARDSGNEWFIKVTNDGRREILRKWSNQ